MCLFFFTRRKFVSGILGSLLSTKVLYGINGILCGCLELNCLLMQCLKCHLYLYLILKQGLFLPCFFVRPDRWDPLVSLSLTSRRRVPPVRPSWAAGGRPSVLGCRWGKDWPQPRPRQIANPRRGSVGINAAQIYLANKIV
jgi:hypothetical protein